MSSSFSRHQLFVSIIFYGSNIWHDTSFCWFPFGLLVNSTIPIFRGASQNNMQVLWSSAIKIGRRSTKLDIQKSTESLKNESRKETIEFRKEIQKEIIVLRKQMQKENGDLREEIVALSKDVKEILVLLSNSK